MINGNDLIEFLKDKYNVHGSLAQYEVDGRPQVFINHPDLIQEVLVKKSKIYHKSDFYAELKNVIGNGLLSVEDGLDWLRKRRLSQPAFNRNKINSFATEIDHVAQEMVESWKQAPEGVVQAHDEFIKITLEVVCRVVLGFTTTSESDVVLKNFPYILKFISIRLFHPTPLSLDHDTPSILKFKKCLAALDDIVKKHIEEKLEMKANGTLEGDDLVTSLLNQDSEETPMEFKELRDQVMTQFLAGHETSATSITYTAYFLAKYPNLQEQLYEHCLQDKNWWEYSELLNFIYESLRLYPSIPLIDKMAMQDDVLNGVKIEKGTHVTISPLILHRTEEFWEDADLFKADRFKDFHLRKNRFLYIPFSEGPRICIGSQLALMEMVLIIRKILINFKLSLNENSDPSYVVAISLRAKGGMPLNIEQRNTA